jgi:type VI protein secretion system component VasK
MEWLGPYMQDEQVGYIALAVLGGALAISFLMTLVLGWYSWRASRLGRLARRFHGRQMMAEELMSSMEAEEKDLRRLMGEMERAGAKG